MYYMVGSHPAFALDTDNAVIELENDENPIKYDVGINGCVDIVGRRIFMPLRNELDKKFFRKEKTAIYSNLLSKNVRLILDKYVLTVTLTAPILALWSNEISGNFICIENWWGLPDNINKDIVNKKFIEKLSPDDTQAYRYSVTIN